MLTRKEALFLWILFCFCFGQNEDKVYFDSSSPSFASVFFQEVKQFYLIFTSRSLVFTPLASVCRWHYVEENDSPTQNCFWTSRHRIEIMVNQEEKGSQSQKITIMNLPIKSDCASDPQNLKKLCLENLRNQKINNYDAFFGIYFINSYEEIIQIGQISESPDKSWFFNPVGYNDIKIKYHEEYGISSQYKTLYDPQTRFRWVYFDSIVGFIVVDLFYCIEISSMFVYLRESVFQDRGVTILRKRNLHATTFYKALDCSTSQGSEIYGKLGRQFMENSRFFLNKNVILSGIIERIPAYFFEFNDILSYEYRAVIYNTASGTPLAALSFSASSTLNSACNLKCYKTSTTLELIECPVNNVKKGWSKHEDAYILNLLCDNEGCLKAINFPKYKPNAILAICNFNPFRNVMDSGYFYNRKGNSGGFPSVKTLFANNGEIFMKTGYFNLVISGDYARMDFWVESTNDLFSFLSKNDGNVHFVHTKRNLNENENYDCLNDKSIHKKNCLDEENISSCFGNIVKRSTTLNNNFYQRRHDYIYSVDGIEYILIAFHVNNNHIPPKFLFAEYMQVNGVKDSVSYNLGGVLVSFPNED